MAEKDGFIDIHIHGGYGIDIMDASARDIAQLSLCLKNDGVAAWTPTLVGDSLPVLEKCVKNICDAKKINSGADILGVHIEGPFISPKKSGVLPKAAIVPCDTAFFDVLSAYGLPLRFTIAPEAENAIDFIEYTVKKGGVVTLGHSDDDGTMTERAIKAGASGFTHLFNAMRGIYHRSGSITQTALLSGLPCEIIADTIHLSPDTVRLVNRTAGPENIVLVTDAMSAMQSQTGEYMFCGQKVIYDGSMVSTKDGVLAGSCLTMRTAAENFCKITGMPPETVRKMTVKNSLRMINRPELAEKYLF